MAFQIQDDLIDIMTSPEKSGKDRASDIREGKQTLITLKAKEKGLDLSEYRRELTDKEIDELIERLDALGVIKDVRETALELVQKGKEIISILPDSEAKDLLIEIGDYFVTRGYDMETDPKNALFIFALQNAVKHNSLPKSGTVIGMVMGKYPEFRPRAQEIAAFAKEVLAEVELLSPDERRKKLCDLAPELIEEMNAPKVHTHRAPQPRTG